MRILLSGSFWAPITSSSTVLTIGLVEYAPCVFEKIRAPCALTSAMQHSGPIAIAP